MELAVTRETVRRWIRKCEINVLNSGRSAGYRIARAELDRFVRNRMLTCVRRLEFSVGVREGYEEERKLLTRQPEIPAAKYRFNQVGRASHGGPLQATPVI